MSEDASDYFAVNGSDLQSDQYVEAYGSGRLPTDYSSTANSFLDLLKTGIGQWAGYETTKLRYQPQATPTYVVAQQPAVAQQQFNQNLLKWGLIAAAVFLVISSMPKAKG